MITVEQLQTLLPNNNNVQNWWQAINDVAPTYDINTNNRLAAFLAQCMHESANFTVLKENLNYSAQSLQRVWPSHFPDEDTANSYAHQPEKIANRAYANRMGNGDEASGDGWLCSGKGAIQMTGRANYQEFADSIEMDFNDVSDYLLTERGAIESACYFFKKHNLNSIADTGDIDQISKIVNGGTLGMAQRHDIYTNVLETLGGSTNG